MAQQQNQPAGEIEVAEQAPGAPGGVDFGKLLQYSGVVMQVIAHLEGIQTLEVGNCQELGEVKFRRGGKSYTLDLGELCRTK